MDDAAGRGRGERHPARGGDRPGSACAARPDRRRLVAADDLAATLDQATVTLSGAFDARTGGWGGSPKFPQPMVIEQLLREHLRTGARGPLDIAVRSLDAMAAGGIRDHLGGGFARYATDSVWLVPHFEKMLYDNAQLALVYLHAWQVTGAPRHAEVARETLDFMARELLVTDADGHGGARRQPRRRHRGRGGQHLRLDRGRGAGGPGTGCAAVRGRVRRHRRRQLGGPHHPVPGPR